MQHSILRAPVADEPKAAGEAYDLRDRPTPLLHSIEVSALPKEAAQAATDHCATAMQVRAILRARRQRDQFFPDDSLPIPPGTYSLNFMLPSFPGVDFQSAAYASGQRSQ